MIDNLAICSSITRIVGTACSRRKPGCRNTDGWKSSEQCIRNHCPWFLSRRHESPCIRLFLLHRCTAHRFRSYRWKHSELNVIPFVPLPAGHCTQDAHQGQDVPNDFAHNRERKQAQNTKTHEGVCRRRWILRASLAMNPQIVQGLHWLIAWAEGAKEISCNNKSREEFFVLNTYIILLEKRNLICKTYWLLGLWIKFGFFTIQCVFPPHDSRASIAAPVTPHADAAGNGFWTTFRPSLRDIFE